MTIYIQTKNGKLQVRDGNHRLQAAISVFGYAIVTDVETDRQLFVKQVDGLLVEMDEQEAAGPKVGDGKAMVVDKSDVKKASSMDIETVLKRAAWARRMRKLSK